MAPEHSYFSFDYIRERVNALTACIGWTMLVGWDEVKTGFLFLDDGGLNVHVTRQMPNIINKTNKGQLQTYFKLLLAKQ